jgi:acyl-CoA synthetase (AMP-forming)/AMP-acid ligase II
LIDARGLWELVEARAAATPSAPCVVDESDRALDFAGYRDAALRAAAGLAAQGVGRETRVSWVLPTGIEAMVLCAALARLGAVQNPILPIYRSREVGFITRQTGARLLCVPGVLRGFDYAAMARALAAEQPELRVLVVDPALPRGNPDALAPPEPPVAPERAPVRWHFYTSGSTAFPKGARHTDATLLASFRGLVRVLEIGPQDRNALVFPFTHVGGIGWLIAGLLSGCAHVAVASFDPKTAIPLLARHGVTLAGAGTAFHQAYLAAQRESDAPIFPKLRALPGGGAPKPPALHGQCKQALGGVGIVSGYGLTECPIIAMNTVRDPDAKLAATEGRVNPPGAEIAVVKVDGSRARAGEEGELRVRGPQLCRGYVDPALDAEAFDADGFFRTGDLGTVDADGYVVITGRLKDVIIRKGENISAREVEDLLFEHPKVADVAVIGLPDPASGERCCAVVAPRDAADPLGFDEMAAWLRSRGLMVQKIPEQLETLDALPRNPAGKVQKQELRRRYAGAPPRR